MRWVLMGLVGSLWLLCSGCATYQTGTGVPRLMVAGSGALVVATHDQRAYVVSGSTNPSFVGLLRSAFGVPWAVKTQSGRPLADEMTEMVCQALTRQGFQCTPVFVAATARPPEVQRRLQTYADTPAVLLTIQEWKSDTHTDTSVYYDIAVQVIDQARVVRADGRIQGKDVPGGTFWNSSSFAARAVPQAVQKHLEALLNDSKILAALQTVHQPVVAALPPFPPGTPSSGMVQLQAQYHEFRLFQQPQTSAERLHPVASGVPLRLLEDRGTWLYVETPEQHRGWVLREWIAQ